MAIRESARALLTANAPRVKRDNPEASAQEAGPSCVSITLPLPPSVNGYWRMGRGKMIVSESGRAYKEEVAKLCMVAHTGKVNGLVSVTVRVYRPRKVGDLDNYEKALFDATKNVLFEDDDQIVRIVAERFDDPKNPRVEIEVRATA